MSSKNIYIISLKFSPGLMKEFVSFGENIRKKGVRVTYLLSSEYRKLDIKVENGKFITSSKNLKSVIIDTIKFSSIKQTLNSLFVDNPPSFVCFYNPHPLNPFIARLVKKRFPKATTALYLHDPYKPDKKSYGMIKGIYITFVEFVQGLTIRHIDHIISPSEYSYRLFNERYPEFKGETHVAPLLVPDQRIKSDKKRRFFSIVGGAHPATGHDVFFELIDYVAEKELSYEFAIITPSDISKYLKKLNNKSKKILKVINKKIITDSEINNVIKESYAVFRLDREVTQSGVVPICYMNETPIIARSITGLRQHIKHKENGYLVSQNCASEDLIKAMDFAKENFSVLSRNARQSYEKIWSEWNWDKYYGWLISILSQ